jgi:ribosomal protein S18 acetylase RimI-like enzyme
MVTGLDNPVWSALTTRQSDLGRTVGSAARFDPEVSPFGAFADPAGPSQWDDLAELVGPSGQVALVGPGEERRGWTVPPGWASHGQIPAVQMTCGRLTDRPDRRPPSDLPVPLGVDDVPDMLALVDLSRPGPFLARTVEFGGYQGIRRDGRLVAMAGQRLRLPGHTEVSAVTTDPGHRGQGLARLLVDAVVALIIERGEAAFLHVAESNVGALSLYLDMGFEVRTTIAFELLQAPISD